jgi:hypothetical protein
MSDGWTTVTAKPKPKPKAPGSNSSGVQQPWQARPAASSGASFGGAAGVQKKCEWGGVDCWLLSCDGREAAWGVGHA